MSAGLFRFSIIFAAAATVATGDEDRARSHSMAPVSGSSLESAKKSFESLNEKPVSSSTQTFSLPTAEFTGGGASAPSVRSNPKELRTAKNWLLDALQTKQPRGREAGSEPSSSRDVSGPRQRQNDDSLFVSDGVITQTPSHAPSEAVEQSRDVIAAGLKGNAQRDSMNPLAVYMSSWISAQDRTLLIAPPALFQSDALIAGSVNPTQPPTLVVSAPAGGRAAPTMLNPYLSDVSPFSTSPPNSASPERATITGGSTASVTLKISPPLLLSEVFAPSVNRVSPQSLNKTSDEEKYFKQLKRF